MTKGSLNELINNKAVGKTALATPGLLIRRLPDQSGRCLIKIRQRPDRSGCCRIKIRQLPERSGRCLINQTATMVKSGSRLIDQAAARLKSGSCQIEIRQLPDQSGPRFVRSLIYIHRKLFKYFIHFHSFVNSCIHFLIKKKYIWKILKKFGKCTLCHSESHQCQHYVFFVYFIVILSCYWLQLCRRSKLMTKIKRGRTYN